MHYRSASGNPVYLHSGEYGATSETGRAFSTALGSCIAVCMRDSENGAGGMNHFLLPGNAPADADTPALFGAEAIRLLAEAIFAEGGKAERLECKLFGGADFRGYSRSIGAENARFAAACLREYGYRLTGGDTGGSISRRVVFTPLSGQIAVRALPEDAFDNEQAARNSAGSV